MRSFIAVDLPISDVFHRTHERLRKMGRSIKPTKPNNQHITLKFLGDPGCSVKRVIDSLDSIQDLPESFNIKLDEVGAFPGWKKPTSECRRLTDLPSAARKYLEFLEAQMGTLIVGVSVGRERDQMIWTETGVTT